jgi:hypothetical protein
MAKHQGMTESEIKAAIKAAQSAFEHQERLRASLSQSAPLLSLQRKLGERLQPVFAEAGLDIEKINNILSEHQREELRVLKEGKSKTEQTFEALNQTFLPGLENRRKAQNYLAAIHHPIVTPILLSSAFNIDEVPAGLPFSSHVEDSNNLARTFFEHGINDGYGSVSINFWFFWQNSSDNVAVIQNIESDLFIQGTSTMIADAHFYNNGQVSLKFQAVLSAFEQQGVIGSDTITIYDHHTTGPHTGDDQIDPASFSDTYHLRIPSYISVPAHSGVVLSVSFQAIYNTWYGRVEFNFDAPSRFIICRGVHMELVMPSQIMGV